MFKTNEKLLYASVSHFDGVCTFYYEKHDNYENIYLICYSDELKKMPKGMPVIRFDLSAIENVLDSIKFDSVECSDIKTPKMFDNPEKFLPLDQYLEALKEHGIVIETSDNLSPIKYI